MQQSIEKEIIQFELSKNPSRNDSDIRIAIYGQAKITKEFAIEAISFPTDSKMLKLIMKKYDYHSLDSEDWLIGFKSLIETGWDLYNVADTIRKNIFMTKEFFEKYDDVKAYLILSGYESLIGKKSSQSSLKNDIKKDRALKNLPPQVDDLLTKYVGDPYNYSVNLEPRTADILAIAPTRLDLKNSFNVTKSYSEYAYVLPLWLRYQYLLGHDCESINVDGICIKNFMRVMALKTKANIPDSCIKLAQYCRNNISSFLEGYKTLYEHGSVVPITSMSLNYGDILTPSYVPERSEMAIFQFSEDMSNCSIKTSFKEGGYDHFDSYLETFQDSDDAGRSDLPCLFENRLTASILSGLTADIKQKCQLEYDKSYAAYKQKYDEYVKDCKKSNYYNYKPEFFSKNEFFTCAAIIQSNAVLASSMYSYDAKFGAYNENFEMLLGSIEYDNSMIFTTAMLNDIIDVIREVAYLGEGTEFLGDDPSKKRDFENELKLMKIMLLGSFYAKNIDLSYSVFIPPFSATTTPLWQGTLKAFGQSDIDKHVNMINSAFAKFGI